MNYKYEPNSDDPISVLFFFERRGSLCYFVSSGRLVLYEFRLWDYLGIQDWSAAQNSGQVFAESTGFMFQLREGINWSSVQLDICF